MRVTQHDIAKRAGVTQRTVSRCFLDPAGVGQGTRERVYRIAHQMGYRLNLAARHVRRGRFDSVTVLNDHGVRWIRGHASLLGGICHRLNEHRLRLALAPLPDAGHDKPGPGHFDRFMADGLLINCHGMPLPPPEDHIRSVGLPSVWINTRREADCVRVDEFGGALKLVEDLMALGHRRIVYLDTQTDEQATTPPAVRQDRQTGYLTFMKRAGLAPDLLLTDAPLDGNGRVDYVRRVLGRRSRPTAVIASGADDGVAVLCAAHAVAGLCVPRDLSIVAFGDGPASTVARLALAQAPWHAVGVGAVDMLLDKMRSPETLLPPRTVAMCFDPGETLAPPP